MSKNNNREKNLAINTVILSVGVFLPKLIAMITVPLLTKYLTKAEYGTYDLILSLVSLLLPAVTLMIQSAAFRFLIKTRDNHQESSVVISNILGFTIPISIVAVIIMFFSLRSFDFFLRIVISVYFLADIILLTIRQIARGFGDNLGYTIDSVLNSVLMLGLLAFELLIRKNGLFGVALSLTVSTVCSVVFLAYRTKIFKYINTKLISIKEIKKLISYSWPMVPNNLSGWVLSLSDRFVITSFLGIEANAVYAAANKLPNLLKSFQSTFMFAWQENASLSVEDDDSKEYYTKMVDGINSLAVSFMAVLIAATPILFNILIKGDYGDAYYQMAILYLGSYFSVISGVFGGIYIAHMKTKNVGITTMLAAACNLAIDFLLIKQVGIFAGSISTMVSYFLLALYRMFDLRKFQPISYNYLKMGGCLVVLIVMSVLSYQKDLTLDIVNFVIGVVVVSVLCGKLIIKIVKKTLHKIFKHA